MAAAEAMKSAGTFAAIEIVNRQRKYALDAAQWEALATRIVRGVKETGGRGVTIAFVSDRRMHELNRSWRGKDKTTDVLSFPYEPEEFELKATGGGESFNAAPPLGDIAVSVAQAARQAAENSLTLDEELAQLILHGVLHLCGYDHETDDGEMNARELALRRRLKI